MTCLLLWAIHNPFRLLFLPGIFKSSSLHCFLLGDVKHCHQMQVAESELQIAPPWGCSSGGHTCLPVPLTPAQKIEPCWQLRAVQLDLLTDFSCPVLVYKFQCWLGPLFCFSTQQTYFLWYLTLIPWIFRAVKTRAKQSGKYFKPYDTACSKTRAFPFNVVHRFLSKAYARHSISNVHSSCWVNKVYGHRAAVSY